jgi:RimJ/RimL family protein N-acetyltransferase
MPSPFPSILRTGRLDLIAATPELADAAAYQPDNLAIGLAATIPADWPPELIEPDNLVFFAQRLREEPSLIGWSAWYVVQREPERTLIGLFGFNGRPEGGAVTLGYALTDPAQGLGYGTEGVRALVEWAFNHPEVTTVAAETFLHLRPSVQLLEKLGFTPGGEPHEPGAVRYQLTRWEWNSRK